MKGLQYSPFEKRHTLYDLYIPDLGGVHFDQPIEQPGFEQSIMGKRQYFKTEWAQGYPSAGLGQLGASDETYMRTAGDVGPHIGLNQDNWKPLWSLNWVKKLAKDQRLEWNTLNVHSGVNESLLYNQGVTFNHPGQPYVLNWERQAAAHPIIEHDKIESSLLKNKFSCTF